MDIEIIRHDVSVIYILLTVITVMGFFSTLALIMISMRNDEYLLSEILNKLPDKKNPKTQKCTKCKQEIKG